jgi:hypothetical protein
MKVEEEIPGDPRSSRLTALGKELQIDLVCAFLGHWELRNPRAHGFIHDDAERALEFIAFVSLLAKLVDEAKK